MINGFFHTIQRDLINVAQAINSEAPHQEQNERISMAALRIFASATMGVGSLIAISTLSFFAAAPVSAVLTAAIGVGIYALGHDAFILAKRFEEEDNPLNVIENRARGLFRDVGNLFRRNPYGNGNVEELTADTFFQPMWVHLLGQRAI